ncbi:uncharacterized protein LODBEIA_P43190 [Lodderomyces beijingensis]|uniref:Uncharacterized protein n=1 Tax=Lodderomyces beijingensis TaxID=1775926 RepID=A0ABP0ZV42_9ASCO
MKDRRESKKKKNQLIYTYRPRPSKPKPEPEQDQLAHYFWSDKARLNNITDTMPTASGFLGSLALGAAMRVFQTALGGSPAKLTQKVTGYGVMMSLTASFYYFIYDPSMTRNQELLQRRLVSLREQREKKERLLSVDDQEDRIFTARDRGRFFKLFEKYSQPYK